MHDPLGRTAIGDRILFFEGKHISKIKYMYFHSVVSLASTNNIDRGDYVNSKTN